jgi:hypothetical protein
MALAVATRAAEVRHAGDVGEVGRVVVALSPDLVAAAVLFAAAIVETQLVATAVIDLDREGAGPRPAP